VPDVLACYCALAASDSALNQSEDLGLKLNTPSGHVLLIQQFDKLPLLLTASSFRRLISTTCYTLVLVSCNCTVCPCSVKAQSVGVEAVAAAVASGCAGCCCCCFCCEVLDAAEVCKAAVTCAATGSRGNAVRRTQTVSTVGHCEHHTTSVTSTNQSL
jgi:hypothetical protein